MNRSRALRIAVAVAAALLVPAVAAAHPLGNFTINHYAGLRISSAEIAIDAVIDHAEIPAFQERQRIDTDRDGSVSTAEQEAERLAACPRLASDMQLLVGGASLALTPIAAGLSFPAGAGGLPTMRVVCEFHAALSKPLTAGSSLTFEDGSYADRIGWREIVVVGDGVSVAGDVSTSSSSERLTAYPESLLNTPPDVRGVSVTVRPGGPPAPPFAAPDAAALNAAVPPPPGTEAIVPGGVGGEIAGLLRTEDLTPLVLLASLLAAAALGAGHALTPGHGKTIMAAFLVGSRGSTRHALGLGLATAVSHTLGVLGLGVLILAAGSALPAERIFPVLSLASALLVVGIGTWMVWRQAPVIARFVRHPALVPVPAGAGGGHAQAFENHGHGNPHEDDHDHDHDHDDNRGHDGHGHGHGHSHSHPHPHPLPGGGPLGWRTLFALGLSGGLVPSTSALLILVATVAAGRPAFGLLLVIAFGLGMATVLVGIGIALVLAGDRLGRVQNRPGLTRALELAPALGAVVVLGLGVVLTLGAVTGAPVL